MLEINKIHQGDCLEIMKHIPDKSVDMILCDLPYGITACKWDTIIPFEPLWEQYKRMIKDNGTIVLTASQPFTSKLVMSNLKMFKYEWIWEKEKPTNFFQLKRRVGNFTENILIFYTSQPTFNPQMVEYKGKPIKNKPKGKHNSIITGKNKEVYPYQDNGLRYPSNILRINREKLGSYLHPTQKPVALFEYLIKTYTNEGDLVLDNCIGSGTTAIACINTKRNFIGIELEPKYVEIANERIAKAKEHKIDLEDGE
jgi:site-specific DNA-methyltransferase (adenine-specific)